MTTILVAGLLPPATASAATQVETVGNPARSLPVAQWIAAAKAPTPDVKVRVRYENCPGDGSPLACAGSLNNGAYDITLTPDWVARYTAAQSDYYRSVVVHELGHVVNAAYFGIQTERDFAVRLGYPEGREWMGDLPIGTPAVPSRIEPSEWFAEAYATCAWGGERPKEYKVYGFNLTYRQVLPICQQISFQITGKPIVAPPAPTVPLLCSPRCEKQLRPYFDFKASEKLVPGTISAVVKVGNKAAMLNKGCKGKVAITGGSVFLNLCSGIVKVNSFSSKKLRVLYWGQTPPVSEPPPLPNTKPARSKVRIEVGAPGPFPIEQWIDSSRIPTPTVNINLAYGRCVNYGAAACTSKYFTGNSVTMWIDPQYLGEPGKDVNYYRALFYRSLGELMTRFYLGPSLQNTLKVWLGFPVTANWGAYDSSVPASTSTPAKWLAEAYATCAWGGDRPASSISFGFNRSHSSLKPICDRLTMLMNGTPLLVAPIKQPAPPSCGNFCTARLSPKTVWSTSLATPASLAAVKIGKRFAVLPKGCSGVVRSGRTAVRLNYCGSKLRARSIGKGKPQLRYWNQPA